MKKITSKLIDKIMQERGFKDEDLERNELEEFIKKKYGITFDDDYSFNSYEYYFYEETTADGYSVFVATHDQSQINIPEDVYYNEGSLAERLVEVIYDLYSDSRIYITDKNDYWFIDALTEIYNDDYQEEANAVIKELKEQGYTE